MPCADGTPWAGGASLPGKGIVRETELTGGKPSTGSYTEWMTMLHKNATFPIYDVALNLPCGLHYEGKSALANDIQ